MTRNIVQSNCIFKLGHLGAISLKQAYSSSLMAFTYKTPWRLLLFLITVVFSGFLLAQNSPRLVLENIPEEINTNLNIHLGLANESCEPSDRRLRLLQQSFDEKINRALRALGYYHSSWDHRTIEIEDCWNLELELDLGEPIYISQVRIDPSDDLENDEDYQEILETTRVQVGAQLNHRAYDSLKSSLQVLTYNKGYLLGNFSTHQLRVDLQNHSAEVELILEPGPRYRIGEISFSDSKYDQEFLARFQDFEPGDFYDADLLTEFRQRLVDSRLFNSVGLIELDPDHQTRLIPIEVALTDKARFVTSLGAGISTDTGPRASVGFANNRVNQKGNRLEFNSAVSSVENSVDLAYQIPLNNPALERATIRSGWLSEDTGTSESDIWYLGASRSKAQRGGWLQTLDLTYQYETDSLGSESSLLIPSVSWIKSQSDDLIFPRQGYRLQYNVRVAHQSLLSDLNFAQFSTSAKRIDRLGPGRVISRLDLGATLLQEDSLLPTSIGFFAGGDNSIRGYDYKELGVLDEANETLGGKYLLVGSLEYEHPIATRSGLALFVDAGNAFDDFDKEFETTIGIGWRWRSPVGPIRMDLAHPLADEGGFKFHLSMGPDL